MADAKKGCLRGLVPLVLLGVLLGVAWTQRAWLVERWQEFRAAGDAEVVATEALALQAEAKLADLEAGRTDAVALGQGELQSLLVFRHSGLLPAFVDSPTVELDGDQLKVRASVPVDRLPSLGELGEAAAFLPDTTEVEVVGKLLPLDDGRVALAVDEVSAARIPLPARMVPAALRRLGRTDEHGLPQDALALPLPRGAAAAYIRGDSLHLLNRRAGASGGAR